MEIIKPHQHKLSDLGHFVMDRLMVRGGWDAFLNLMESDAFAPINRCLDEILELNFQGVDRGD